MNLNLSASVNVFRLLARPALCLPHGVVSTFNDIPIPLDSAFAPGTGKDGRKPEIKAVVLDKDDCFAFPESSEVYAAYKVRLADRTIFDRVDTDVLGPLPKTSQGLPRQAAAHRVQHGRCSELRQGPQLAGDG